MAQKQTPARKRKTWKTEHATEARGHVRGQQPALPGLTNHCFGCAPENRHGLHLKFTEHPETRSVAAQFHVARQFEGPPGHVHGGIIATILDEAMGKVSRQKGVIALTGRMEIDYLKPVPLSVPLRAVGWEVRREGRKHHHAGEIRAMDGTVLARSQGVFIQIDPEKMFRKFRDVLIRQ